MHPQLIYFSEMFGPVKDPEGTKIYFSCTWCKRKWNVLKQQNNPKRQIPYEKLVLSQLLKKYPAFYWTWLVTTIFSRAQLLSLSCDSLFPPILLLKSIIMLPSYAFGWGSAPQAGRSWVQFPMGSLLLLIDLILPAALWPWGRLSIQQKWVLLISSERLGGGVKGGRCLEQTTLVS
jgi:hypothetical protein